MSDAAEPVQPPLEEPQMEIHHKPKTWHGWHEFLKEFGTIVLGVSVALAAEQGVEWLHWRGKVVQAREQIAEETASNMIVAILRIRMSSCVEQRLDALALILDAASKSGSLPPVGDIGMPRQLQLSVGVWDSLVASETAPHFPSGQLQRLAATYKYVQRIDETTRQELEHWTVLYGIVGPGRHLDPVSEAQLRQALGQARGSNRFVTNLSSLLIRATGNMELEFSPGDRARLAQVKQYQLMGHKPQLYMPLGSSICDPIGPVPTAYGQAPLSAMPALLSDAVKAIPDFSRDPK